MIEKLKKPFFLTIYGASGDLAKLKLFPSLYSLAAQHILPKDFYILGYARSKKSHQEFQEEFLQSIIAAHGQEPNFSLPTAKKLTEHVFYFFGNYDQLTDFVSCRKFAEQVVGKKSFSAMTKIAYLSVPPKVFQPIIQNLAQSQKRDKEDLRIVVEKPFGDDEASARQLFHFISRYFEEDQVYLLDHYLGKSGVQSILSLRHANSILNMLLKGKEIASIQLSALEEIGVANRVGYFDSVGIIKDMFQSHLTQILAMITMSIPITETAESFHREKYAILSALKFSPKKDHIFLGQYKGYQELEGVQKNSCTETFMSVKVKIDRESWYGVPIFIRTGKKLHKKSTYVVIEFKRHGFQKRMAPNRLVIELQPNEQIHFKLLNKLGQTSDYHEVTPSQSIACTGTDCLPEHATLLLDVFQGEKLHFLSFAEIIAAWRITDSILNFIKKDNTPVEIYEHGYASPQGSACIFRKEGEGWYEI